MPLPKTPRPPTLDQIQVFLAVVEEGSFVGAARRLSRATSVISYAIANLESQLELELFDRNTTRKPQLTDAGRAVLAELRKVSMGVEDLLAKARGLLTGLEAEVVLVVDVMFPTAWLVEVMQDFQKTFPTVGLRLHVEALGAVAQHVLDGSATIGVSGAIEIKTAQLERYSFAGVRLIPVAAPTHPLSQHQGEVTQAMARNYQQLVLTDRSRLTEGQDFGVIAVRTLRLTDLNAKYALLLAGLGWGSMPETMISDDIASGRLSVLQSSEWRHATYRFQTLSRTDIPPGPAARWMLQRFRETSWQV
ncbi:LysR family transcriptional regulator [Undibacterium terreum]|uniref:LysR family transcriptional regulator n=1 Tax=Undibacterium terreum TaxID=1224302 RepID=A0A916UD56_9BURK|nr:LysR family transcriptional regulator [Undibacterium terreum]GGC69383.1 LysR family transcriptional regulator [Undibacterium terreum]